MLLRNAKEAEGIYGITEMNCSECGRHTPILINCMMQGYRAFFCENCATFISRILMQDILEHQTGHPISLLGIMHHGIKDANRHRLPPGTRPNGKPVEGTENNKRALFDF